MLTLLSLKEKGIKLQIKYISSIRNLKESKIEELVDLEVGDWFSSLEIDNSIKKLQIEHLKWVMHLLMSPKN